VCEAHSIENGYRWSPAKSVQLSSNGNDETLRLYQQAITRTGAFTYLGVPFTTSGADWDSLVEKNVTAARRSAAIMSEIGLNSRSFSSHRCVILWKAFVRSCLDYGLAVANLSPAAIKTLDKCQKSTLQRIFGGHDRSNLDVMLELASTETYTQRSMELQCRWAIRAMKANDNNAMVKLWLDDALNDRSSPLRQRLDSNNLYNNHIHRDKSVPIGCQIPRLWTAVEDAAVRFGSARNRPWSGFPAGTRNAYRHTSRWGLDVDTVRESRRQRIHQTKVQAAATGKKQYLRDLPPFNRPILRPLQQLQRRHQRLLICWWIGAIPGHSDEQLCGICNQQIYEGEDGIGARAHVSECVCRLHQDITAVFDTAIGRHRFPAYALDWRSSKDVITQMIWLAYKYRHFEPGDLYMETALNALEAVSRDCLRRDF
jgi:hypothetical protein